MTEASHPTTLAGKRVLVTRPAHQSAEQIAQLKQLGVDVVTLPVLEIKPFSPPATEYHLAKSRILDLDLYQHVIFISANAARIGAELIDDYWPQLPIKVCWLAIGKITAATLANYGIDAESSTLGYDSEALLESSALQDVSDSRILIIRGQGGREKLAETLRERGAQVEYADLYQRVRPVYNDTLIEETLYQQRPDALLVTSSEGLNNLLLLAHGNQRQYDPSTLFSCQLVVPSERVAQQAQLAGFKRITTAAGADDLAMITALLPATDAESDK